MADGRSGSGVPGLGSRGSLENWATGGSTEPEVQPPSFAMELIGKVLEEKYEIVRLIGEGGMGAVYEARHLAIGNRVAIKVLHPEMARKPELIQRFRREAQAAGTIGHANIVQVHDIGQTREGIPFMVMEFIEGRSLANAIVAEAPLDPARASRIAEQVLAALGAAHAKGIVHRDIKPENVILSTGPDGTETVRVLDFGISKIREGGPESQGLTRTGTILGTPLYMAPEQARGETDVDHRIDLYAVGVMLYVMLTGRQPYHASNYNALLVQIVTEAPPPLAEVMPGLSPALVATVDRAMARDKSQRFLSADEFVEALRGRAPARPPATVIVTPDEAPRSGRSLFVPLAVLGALLVLGLSGAGAYFAFRGGEGEGTTDGPAGGGPSTGLGPVPSTPDSGARPATGPAGDGGHRSDVVVAVIDDDRITVNIEVEPADARVTINGRQVPTPVNERIGRAVDETILVRVEAEGYRPEERTYSRANDILGERIVLRAARGGGGRPSPHGPNVKRGLE